jgi:uncharacterized membrane protein
LVEEHRRATGRAIPVNLKPALLISMAIVALMFALALWAWAQLEPGASIPVHWGVDGQADRYGGKIEGLLLLPLITLAIAVMFAVIPRIEPRRLNLQQSSTAYTWIWIAVVGFMAGIHVVAVAAALGKPVNMSLVMSIGLGLMYGVIGLVLPRVESNYHVGIRTPWTLTSELSWRRTHRLSGWLFVALGASTALSTLAGDPDMTLAIGVGGALLVAGVSVVYSYFVWRGDPEKDRTGR